MTTQELICASLQEATRAFYRRCLRTLNEAGVPFLIGGAYAFAEYTGITRQTKDLDIFVHPDDCRRALDALSRAGYVTELTDPVWLGKAFSPQGKFIDLIFRSGNGLAEVDSIWFDYAKRGELLGEPVLFCPVEETIWSKAFIMERGRYDGSDISHYFLACGNRIDWDRLSQRFGSHWRVLFSHLILFGFIFPDERWLIPQWLMKEYLARLTDEVDTRPEATRLCQGTLLSRVYYLLDLKEGGYRDARFCTPSTLSPMQIEAWQQQVEQDVPHLLRQAGIGLHLMQGDEAAG
jgi:hypothetical protein